jgi:4-amino-4-deoxy-L-arabinose transferase-like glycosyltransferase
VPQLGIQNDEALFGAALYEPSGLEYHRWFFGYKIPVMLMTYLGALKAWVYAGVFRIWEPGPASIRIPALAIGTLAVWLFYLLLRRISSARAAVAGCVLLATDTSYLLTAVFDWGPVALQHLLLVGGVLLLAVFAQKGGWQALAGGCFLLGAGLWDKALFVWLLAGLAVALTAVWPREIARMFTLRRTALAVLAFCLGSLPLLLYNLRPGRPMETFRSNASWSAADLPGKARLARYSLEGSALFGWLVAEHYEVPAPLPPRSALQAASLELSRASGQPRRNLLGYAFLFSLGIWIWLWRRQGWKGDVRIVAAALVFLGVAWIQMALTEGAGGALHHVVLLWPAPHLVIAVVLAAASRRIRWGAAPAAAAVAALAASGLLVTNQYHAQMVQNGGGLNWTEAIYPLTGAVKKMPARHFIVIDWGILDTLRLLGRGSLPLVMGCDPVSKPALDDADRQRVLSWVSEPSNIFIGHTEGNEFFAGSRKNLHEAAAGFGFRAEMLHVTPDLHGRPLFEVFRFVR